MSMSLLPEPKQSYEDSNGRPLNGGKLYTYAAGTTTPKATYQDAAGTIPNTNPVVLNERGEATVYATGNYRLVLQSSGGSTIWDRDNVAASVSGTDLSGNNGALLIGYDGTTLDQILKSRLTRVVDTISQLRALDKTKYTRAIMFGYNAAGDWGMQIFWFDPSDTTSADNNVTIIVGADNARWKAASAFELSSKQGGAKGDKSTDDTVALQRVAAAMKIGATYRLVTAPGDSYIVSKQGANPSCLDFSRPFNVRADGLYSAVQPTAGTTAANVLMKPDPSLYPIGCIWEGLTIGDPYTGQRAGGNGIYVDTTVEGAQLTKHTFSRLNVLEAPAGAGFLHINVPTGINANGGMFCSTISDSSIKGGINLQGSGDSNTIHRNIISGPNTGIYASLVSGASMLTMVDNNITATDGTLRMDSGSRFKFLRNNCEQRVPFTGSQQYLLDIAGSNGTMSTGEIRGNFLAIFSSVPNNGVIRVGNSHGTHIEDNVILNANGGGIGIVVDATSVNTRIGPNTYGSGVTTKVVDNGIGTMGVIKAINTFANNWGNIGAGPTSPARFYKDGHGTVHLAGLIGLGTTTQGTLMFTLPAGFRPDYPTRLPALTNNGSGLLAGEIRIDTAGAVTFWFGQNTYVSLDGLTFPAAGLADTVSDL
ncbi:hypothetical protein [Cupriavidus plantarum]|uniref:hypothetical protein n=1 Tax=Cupriavidus plantarum TaxID=942865 RepID=UPI000EAED8CC|nr:hypothetical protein [Cupriavidus plantarum]RLK36110.1 hypothetical protein C7417_3885 [Cupriavidus plantarum]